MLGDRVGSTLVLGSIMVIVIADQVAVVIVVTIIGSYKTCSFVIQNPPLTFIISSSSINLKSKEESNSHRHSIIMTKFFTIP